ncbi:hypothetical protein [Facilibium subflavum]|uniref:hypothetical protein n=1 Tax=Facilibium subflavum TaxID=2219058 RepID=UPI000E64BFB0|nr:hypothetical protein [Facilibium subflavum]
MHQEMTDMKHLDTTFLIAIIAAMIVIYIIAILFSWQTYRLVKSIDKEKRIFAPWFAWLFLVPLITYIFQWLMLPFGIGKALQKYENPQIKQKGKVLFNLGLGIVIIELFFWIPMPLITPAAPLIVLIVWIIYWVQMNKAYKLLQIQPDGDIHQPPLPETSK